MKTLEQLTEIEIADIAAKPLQERCDRIIDEFDEWLTPRVRRFKVAWEELPKLNDAIRDYFASTRTSRGALLRAPGIASEKVAAGPAQPEPATEAPKAWGSLLQSEILPLSARATEARLRISVSPERSVRPRVLSVKEPDGTAWHVITVTVNGLSRWYGDPPYPACPGNAWIDLEVECPHDHPPTKANPIELHGAILCAPSDLPVRPANTERDRRWLQDFRGPRGVNAFEACADGAVIIYAELPDLDGEPVRIEPHRVRDLLATCGDALAQKPNDDISSFRALTDGALIIHDTALNSAPIRVEPHLVGLLLLTCSDALARMPNMRGVG